MISNTELLFVVMSVVLMWCAGMLGNRDKFKWGFLCLFMSMMFSGALAAAWMIESDATIATKLIRNVICNTPLTVGAIMYLQWGLFDLSKASFAFWVSVAAHAFIMSSFYL